MTRFGYFLHDRHINKASVSRMTGINKNRLSELSNNPKTFLRVEELYLIAKAIDVDACELLEYVCEGMELEGGEKGE